MSNKNKILCVDDEKDIVDCLADTFMDAYEVRTAQSGQEALKILDREEIVLIITDQRMPEMQGVELLARAKEINPYCKKILLTGYADINAAIDAINKGSVDRYFNKPWDDDELKVAVAHLVKMYDFDRVTRHVLAERKANTDELAAKRAEVETLGAFLACLPKGACVLDDNGVIMHVNPKGLALLGCNDASLILGKHYREVFLVRPEQLDGLSGKSCAGSCEPSPMEITLPGTAVANVGGSLLWAEDGDGPAQVRGIIFGPVQG